MSLVSPGIEVTVIDQSQYLPAPSNSIPLVVLATAQNKPDASGTAVAAGTTSTNANKLFQITSQRDLVNLYGSPFFYKTTTGTPIQGYELNEYGLLAAYSALGATNRVYVLRADIDLAALVGQTSRPSGLPDNNAYWLNTINTTWGIYQFNSSTGKFSNVTPIVLTNSSDLSGGVPLASLGTIGSYAVYANQITSAPDSGKEYFYKTTANVWVPLGSDDWKKDIPTVQASNSSPVLTAGWNFTMNVGGLYLTTISVPLANNNVVQGVADEINNLGWTGITASVRSGKLCIFNSDYSTDFITLANSNSAEDVLGELGIVAGTYYAPKFQYGTAAQMPMWSSSQAKPRPSGSVWLKVGSAGSGFVPSLSRFSAATNSWVAQSVSLAETDAAVNATLDSTGGGAIPAGTVYAQYNFNGYNEGPIYLWSRGATGATVVTGTTTNWTLGGPFTLKAYVSSAGSSSYSSAYTVSIPLGCTPTQFVTAWSAANIPNTTAVVTSTGAIELSHTLGGVIILDDYVNGISNGVLTSIGMIPGTTTGVKFGPGVDTTKSITVTSTEAVNNYVVCDSTAQLSAGDIIGFSGTVGALPTVTTTGQITAGTTLVLAAANSGIFPGMVVAGTGITGTTYVSAIAAGGLTITLAGAAATPSAAGQTYTFTSAGLTPGVNYTVGTVIDSNRFTVIDPATTVVAALATTSGLNVKASVLTHDPLVGKTGATFDISAQYGKYIINGDGVARGGSGYVVGDQLTFSGTLLGGTTPANDLVVEVTSNTAATGSGIIGFKGSGVLATAVITASATSTTSAAFTGSIAGSTLTVTSVASGTIGIEQTLVGAGIVAGTYITAFAGVVGGFNTYTLNQASPVGSIAMTSVTTTMTVTDNATSVALTDNITTGDKLYGTGIGVVDGTRITNGPGTTTGSFTISGTATAFSSQKIYVVNDGDTGDVLDVTGWTAGVLGNSALVNPGGPTDITGTVASQNIANNSVSASTTAIGLAGATLLTVASTDGIVVGQFVSGVGVANATTVSAVDTVAKTVTISAALGAAAVGGTYTYQFRDAGNLGIYTLGAGVTTTPQLGAAAPTLIKQPSSLLTITSMVSGSFGVGQIVTGSSALVPPSVNIATLGTGTGGVGTYNLLVAGAQYSENTFYADLGKAGAITYVSGVPATPTAYSAQLSNWLPISYTSSSTSPVNDPSDDTMWFYSVANQVDIMVQKNGQWIGYRNTSYDSSGAPAAAGANQTDPNGPIISASKPTLQSDGTALVYGDLWVDTSDLENYPLINRWESVNGKDQWVRIDNSDQTTSNGILFSDARWGSSGSIDPINDSIPTIVSLLTSDYLDLDAPSAALYPQGTLLFNTRRSGYNVKKFQNNRWNAIDYPNGPLPTVPSAWVTASGNKSDGSPFMGRKAQRAMVVQAMRSAIDTNTAIRDEDNAFNLICAPGYPELQPNMIALNADRGYTGYILGDTPFRLADDATAIQNWATNAAGATSTGEDGLVSRDSYLGLFYPSGIATNLDGSEVAVPASHMMLRTFLRNDTVAYPWLAAAGTRRGTIDNALNIGYIDSQTGEFQTIKTRVGIRDVLYTNQINPLVFFTGVGLLNYGNKSSFNSQSAMDRTNVSRLIAYIRRQLTLATRPFIFEPNDSLTRREVQGVIQTLMVDLVAKRGLYDYLVVCDESNNTPARIDRNELWCDLAVEPVKAIEFIYIPIRILNTGELASGG